MASGGMGHKGDVTGVDPDVIGSVTGADVERDNIGVTRGDVEVGTWEEIEDVTCRGPNRVLIGCEDMALT